MKRGKVFALHLSAFAGALALLWLCLTMCAAIPNSAIHRNMEKSALSYKTTQAYAFDGSARLCTLADNYADAILLGVSWQMGEGSAFVSALDTKYFDNPDYGEHIGLYQAVTQGAEPNTDYSRYWHGTAIFVRLMHLFTDVNGIKLVGFILAILLALLTCAVLIRRRHFGFAAAFALSAVAIGIWNIRLSMEYQICFVLGFGLCPLFLWLERKGDMWLTVLSVISGVSTAFFDFLTTETVTILLPLVLVISVRAKEGRLGDLKSALTLVIKCGICWICAYGGAFLIKWSLASLVTRENKFISAFSSVGERFGGSVENFGVSHPLLTVLAAPVANLTVLFGGRERLELMRVLIGLVLCCAVLFSAYYLFRQKHRHSSAIKLLWMLGAVVFLRYMLLGNHSYMHEFFTYRALITPICAILCSLVLSTQRPQAKRGRRK